MSFSDPDDIENQLADIDLEKLAGTETAHEVIAAMKPEDLDGDDPVDGVASDQFDNSASPDSASDSPVRQPENLPECQNDEGSLDNPVKLKRFVSVFRDAEYMRYLKAWFDNAPIPVRTTPLVGKVLSPTPDESTRSLLNHTTPKKPFWKVTKPWWDSVNGGKPLPAPARQYRAPAPWRDISDPLLITYLHIALKTMGPVHTLNLNLSAEVEKQARDQKYPLGWLHCRISRHLKKALERPVEFFLVPEESDHHRLHLHGEFQVSEDEAKPARAALRKAGGKCDLPPNRQARTAFDPDRGWVDYLLIWGGSASPGTICQS